jgi:Flp pilus assembly CpaE family ATPase
MLKRKIETRVDGERKWPYTPDELIEMLDRGLLKEIFTACDVTLSLYPHRASLKNMPDHKHHIHLSTLHQHRKKSRSIMLSMLQ